MDFKNKYFKYKKKYISLKNQQNSGAGGTGGAGGAGGAGGESKSGPSYTQLLQQQQQQHLWRRYMIGPRVHGYIDVIGVSEETRRWISDGGLDGLINMNAKAWLQRQQPRGEPVDDSLHSVVRENAGEMYREREIFIETVGLQDVVGFVRRSRDSRGVSEVVRLVLNGNLPSSGLVTELVKREQAAVEEAEANQKATGFMKESTLRERVESIVWLRLSNEKNINDQEKLGIVYHVVSEINRLFAKTLLEEKMWEEYGIDYVEKLAREKIKEYN